MFDIDTINKPIFIINGSAGVGKDTFVHMCDIYTKILNYSSVDKVKDIARMIGWDGSKDEISRKFLSDLKILTTAYNDMPFNAMRMQVDFFRKNENYKAMFLHIREPMEIKRAKQEFGANTILVVRDSVKHVTSNMADANVFNCEYDYVIKNNGSLDDLKKTAKEFLIAQGVL